MEILQVIILAIVQALTEFLPISSSGHLALIQKLMGMAEPRLLLDLSLHMGTLLAVIIFFFRDLINILFDAVSAIGELAQGNRWNDVMYRNPNLKLFIYVCVATIPAGVVGIIFLKTIEVSFGSLRFIGFAFLFTGIVVFLTRRIASKERNMNELSLMDSIWIGVAQAVALLPGVSRSGMTISMGLFRGLDRDLAFRFSFIMSIPAILGSFILEARHHAGEFSDGHLPLYLFGAIISFVVGILVIKVLSRIVIRGNFYLFAFYSFLIGAVTLILSIWIS
ncbi:MAG: undecaprenyl-diphosphate phosphatase [Candidatus Omnitrophica bacterium]|nr:undecaprenyl-diphosphate phosphatase [Candidatus Omnitrophota bacterium]